MKVELKNFSLLLLIIWINHIYIYMYIYIYINACMYVTIKKIYIYIIFLRHCCGLISEVTSRDRLSHCQVTLSHACLVTIVRPLKEPLVMVRATVVITGQYENHYFFQRKTKIMLSCKPFLILIRITELYKSKVNNII